MTEYLFLMGFQLYLKIMDDLRGIERVKFAKNR